MSPRPPPQSCDTFVVLPDLTKGGHVVFGKNSDRPQHEVQEIIYCAAADHEAGSKVQVSVECASLQISYQLFFWFVIVFCIAFVVIYFPSWVLGGIIG